jgi:hypothetical protein
VPVKGFTSHPLVSYYNRNSEKDFEMTNTQTDKTSQAEVSLADLLPVLQRTNKIVYNYLKDHDLKLQYAEFGQYKILLINSMFASALGYRVNANFEPFDYDPDTNTIIIYHHPSRTLESLINVINKLLAHFDAFLEAAPTRTYKEKFPKGLQHVPAYKSAILIGSLYSYEVYYNSYNYLSCDINKDYFHDVI